MSFRYVITETYFKDYGDIFQGLQRYKNEKYILPFNSFKVEASRNMSNRTSLTTTTLNLWSDLAANNVAPSVPLINPRVLALRQDETTGTEEQVHSLKDAQMRAFWEAPYKQGPVREFLYIPYRCDFKPMRAKAMYH